MIPSKHSIKFSDLLRVKRGAEMPEGVNAIPHEAVKAIGDEDFYEAFKQVELGKWYGTLVCKKDGTRFVFRHGVCQSFTKKMHLYAHEFEMNVINETIDFRKEKTNESVN